MDIRMTNSRWVGFSTDELWTISNAAKHYNFHRLADLGDLINELDYEIRKRGDICELAGEADGEAEAGETL